MIMRPLYKNLDEIRWMEKIDFFRSHLSPCRLCPRQCGARREQNNAGLCGALEDVKIASANLHQGEEPPISGARGSGTVFFSGCTLKCIFCQNFPISHLFNGKFYSIEEFAGLLTNLQRRGAHNINLVTGTPYLFHFVQALRLACRAGLNIPVVYNSSGYERPEIIAGLENIVDIYMPDLKYVDSTVSADCTGVTDYFQYAYPAVREMFRQTGPLQFDENDIAVQGTIVRHLILPGKIENSRKVLNAIAGSSFKDAHLSLMSQYFPAYDAAKKPGFDRLLRHDEYQQVKDLAVELDFSDGWFQDMDAPGGA
jgi:putative pyruvate formate lyase activating enzyme